MEIQEAALRFSQIDLVINNTLSSQFALNYDGTIYSAKDGKSSNWKSNALYVNYDPTSTIGFTLRAELFDDKSALSAGAFGTSIFANTLSMNYKIKKLTIIPELRLIMQKIIYTLTVITNQLAVIPVLL